MAGLVFGELGRAPEVGDAVRSDGLRLSVLEIEGSRIMKIEVEFGADDDARPLTSRQPRRFDRMSRAGELCRSGTATSALFWVALVTEAFALAMSFVAIGWQVYSVRENPLDLGLVGLAEFLPLPPARAPRRAARRPRARAGTCWR